MLYPLVGLGYQVQKVSSMALGETKQTFKIILIEFAFFVFLTKVMGVTGLIASILMSNTSATIYGAYIAHIKTIASHRDNILNR